MADGYHLEMKVATVLRGLGFEQDDFQKATDHLSGGWQMRLALAKLLLGQPDLLLLDEPTNHLDLEARNWLEAYLEAYPGSVILVSHDRYFLDAVVTRIADLSLRTLTDYHCNYSDLPGAARRPARSAARGQEEAGRRGRARPGVHRSLPLPGDEGGAGPEPHQDAREGRAHRCPARAQADPLSVSKRAEERSDGVRAGGGSQGLRSQGGARQRRRAHRTRRSDCARGPQRCRQVHADAVAVGGRTTGSRDPAGRPPGRRRSTSRRTKPRASIHG